MVREAPIEPLNPTSPLLDAPPRLWPRHPRTLAGTFLCDMQRDEDRQGIRLPGCRTENTASGSRRLSWIGLWRRQTKGYLKAAGASALASDWSRDGALRRPQDIAARDGPYLVL
jgi:hypothetical protein